MCSLYYLDTYKREYIEIRRYKGESRGGFLKLLRTPEDDGDIESFHNSVKTDYLWVNNLETFENARKLMQYAFTDCNTARTHTSISFQSPDEFERRRNESGDLKDKFPEERNRNEERILKNRIEMKRRLNENVSLED